jgi:hypothetical protein
MPTPPTPHTGGLHLSRQDQLWAAGALGAAALVWITLRKGSTASTSDASGSTGSGVGTLGTYDSSATDAYNNFSNQLDQYGSEITDLQTQLAGLQTGTTGTKTTTGTTTKKTTPAKKTTKPAAKQRVYTVPQARQSSWKTLGQWEAWHHISDAQLRKLNPWAFGISKSMRIKPGTKIRLG